MSKPTPGPWELDDGLCEITGIWRVRFPDDIPHLPDPERKLGVAVVGSEANARLISASPDLLSIARLALKASQIDINDFMGRIEVNLLLGMIGGAAKVALAKVDGEEVTV